MDEKSDDARQEAQRVNAVTAAFIAKRPIPAAQPKLRSLAPRLLCPPEERALAQKLMTRRSDAGDPTRKPVLPRLTGTEGSWLPNRLPR